VVNANVYDIIGDVHGSADKLTGLLHRLGYRERDGAYRLSGHRAVFVGDVVDRGPEQVRTLRVVRSMVDAGCAQMVMGNHEFNAIGYATRDPRTRSNFLRTHTGAKGATNRAQHEAFLAAMPFGSAIYRETVAWFTTLPLWLEFDQFRVVHACWHQASIDVVRGLAGERGTVDDDFLTVALRKGTDEYAATTTILKGPEVRLVDYDQPAFIDVDGRVRRRARLRWWLPRAATLRRAVVIPEGVTTTDGRAYPALPDVACAEAAAFYYDPAEKPVFFGHYVRSGSPTVEGPATVCLDYGAERDGGSLVAYRFDGDPRLTNERFVAYPG
jgi:hypothetical protein